MGEVIDFKTAVPTRTRACSTCRFKIDSRQLNTPRWWSCGVSGRYCSDELHDPDGCGPAKSLWAPIEKKDKDVAYVDVLYVIASVFGGAVAVVVLVLVFYYLVLRGN